MTLQQIVERLRSECASLVLVELLHDLTDIAVPEFDTPAAFVLALPDGAIDPNAGMGALVSQRRTHRFGVITVARAPTEVDEPSEVARAEVFAALVGWAPLGEDIQIQVGAPGELLGLEAGLVRMLDIFSYDTYLRYLR